MIWVDIRKISFAFVVILAMYSCYLWFCFVNVLAILFFLMHMQNYM
jgi:hypothetical protein